MTNRDSRLMTALRVLLISQFVIWLLCFLVEGFLVVAAEPLPEVGDPLTESASELRKLSRAEQNDDDDENQDQFGYAQSKHWSPPLQRQR